MDPCLIPLPTSPPMRPVLSLDHPSVPSRRTTSIAPAEIPLPLSPILSAHDAKQRTTPTPTPTRTAPPLPEGKPRLPTRRPAGWTPTSASQGHDSRSVSMPGKVRPGTTLPPTGGLFAGRVISGPLVISGSGAKGRRVSGAMQYALIPSPPDSSASSLDHLPAADEDDLEDSPDGFSQVDQEVNHVDQARHEHSEVMADGQNSANATNTTADVDPTAIDPGLYDEIQVDTDADADDPDRRAVWRHLAEITSDPEREEDAAWMAYVRSQLAALFPDFFGAEDLAELDEHSDQDAGLEVSENRSGETYDVDTPDGSFAAPFHPGYRSFHDHRAPGFALAFPSLQQRTLRQDPAHGTSRTPSETPSTLSTLSTLPVPRLVSDSSTASSWSLPTPRDSPAPFRLDFSGAGAGVGDGVGAGTTIPSVRDEISAMREEMERLRSFVGNLARGSRQEGDPAVTHNGHDQETQVAGAALRRDTEQDGGESPSMATTGEITLQHSSLDDSHVEAEATVSQALLDVNPPLLRNSTHWPADTVVQNLASAASLIRTLHRAMSRSPGGENAEQSGHDDEHIFSATNLAALEAAVVGSHWALRA